MRALVALVGLVGCSGGADTPSEPAQGGGDTLVFAVPFDLGNVNPLVAPYALSGMVTELVSPGLVRRMVGPDGLYYEPALAESWVWNEDQTALTYTLREGLTWQDGEPLDARDVQFTHELMFDPDVASNWLGNGKYIAGVDAPDARTVTFRFAKAQNPLLQQGYTIRGILPEHVLAGVDRSTLRGHASGRDPLASGPFRIASWAANEKIVLEPNPNAPEAWRPKLDRIVMRVIPEYGTRLLELQRGDVDLIADVEPEDVPMLRADPRLEVIVQAADGMEYIGYNLTKPMFEDVRLRKALTLGLDRDGLMREMLTVDGVVHGRPCIGTIAPTLGAWNAADVAPLPYDLDAAKALLDEAGWKDANGDGVRDKGGTPLRFAMMVQTGSKRAERTAVRTQAAWKAVGAQLDIEMVEPTRFSERARAKEFDAVLWGFGANPRVDPSMEWRSDGQYNWFGYVNPAVDAKVDEGLTATDPAVAQAAIREVQRLVHEDQPATFLFWYDNFSAIDRRFRDTEHNTFTALLHAERWWVPPEEQRYKRR